ncbi:hypothetical protein IG631_02823 [Alternaria alternata]|nr:hypothetical protein IG631_02823 [Alternaria alternata]
MHEARVATTPGWAWRGTCSHDSCRLLFGHEACVELAQGRRVVLSQLQGQLRIFATAVTVTMTSHIHLATTEPLTLVKLCRH